MFARLQLLLGWVLLSSSCFAAEPNRRLLKGYGDDQSSHSPQTGYGRGGSGYSSYGGSGHSSYGKDEEEEHHPAGVNLLIFGNSISDTGNLFAVNQGTFPDPRIYFQGRYSNGPIWPDYLEAEGISVTNYAFITAQACPSPPASVELTPSITTQVSSYLQGVAPAATPSTNTQAPFDAAVILGGANDYIQPIVAAEFSSGDCQTFGLEEFLDSIIPSPESVVSCIMDSVESLIPSFHKPTTLLVAGLPNLGQSPSFSLLPAEIAQAVQARAAAISEEHNRLLLAEIRRFQTLVRPRAPVQLEFLDLVALFGSITQADNLKELGITITDAACVQLKSFSSAEVESVCKDPSKYIFYDPFHYTTIIHSEVAKGLATVLDGILDGKGKAKIY